MKRRASRGLQVLVAVLLALAITGGVLLVRSASALAPEPGAAAHEHEHGSGEHAH